MAYHLEAVVFIVVKKIVSNCQLKCFATQGEIN